MNNDLPRNMWRQIAIIIAVAAVFFLSIYLKSSYYRTMPFLPDGDTYYPGMMANYINTTGSPTVNVPFEVPAVPNGAPLVFPILIAQIHQLSGISVLTVLRWFGPIISAVIALALYALIRRITTSSLFALLGMILTLFVPLYAGRLSATFPESIIILFIPIVLLLVIDGVEEHHLESLLAALVIVVSAVGYHFVSYLLWPVVFLGGLLFFVGRHWRKRNVIYFFLLVGTTLAVISRLYSNWWLFGFLQSLFHIYAGTAVSGVSSQSASSLPAPTLAEWFAQLGYVPVITAFAGAVFFLINRKISWRVKLIILGCTLTILLPLQILPGLKLFSYTPWRAFVYLTPTLLVFSALFFNLIQKLFSQRFVLFIGVIIIAALAPSFGAPGVAGAGEQQLTKGEYRGVAWLQKNVGSRTVIITAPANGRQIDFFTMHDIAYDTAPTIFYAKSPEEALQEIRKLGDYSQADIYVSKYKLGPVYNFGWVRDYAYVNADLTKFSDSPSFKTVYEDADSVIYQTVALSK